MRLVCTIKFRLIPLHYGTNLFISGQILIAKHNKKGARDFKFKMALNEYYLAIYIYYCFIRKHLFLKVYFQILI